MENSTSILLSSYYANNKAYLANDGNVKTTEIYCSYTIIQQTKAWLQVDLGEQYSINNVKIYYRSEGKSELNLYCIKGNICPRFIFGPIALVLALC